MPRKKRSKNKQNPKGTFKQYLLPPAVGFTVMFLVFGIFNSQYISGVIASAGSKNSTQETAQVNEDLQNSQVTENIQDTIKIASLEVNAPIISAPSGSTEETFQQLLQDGVVHYPGTARPGEQGNSVIFGHSSGRWWAPGEYKFVFSKLEKLENQDKIFIDFAGERFMYEVMDKQVVSPYEVSVLSQTKDHRLTLLTCYPVGSNAQRLIVIAKQVLPAPQDTQNEGIEPSRDTQQPQALPAQVPSFWNNARSLF